MKRTYRKLACILTAAILGGMLPTAQVSAQAGESILIPDSAYLSDHAGMLEVTITGDREIRVIVEKHTPDGVIAYYNTLLEESGTYAFSLDSCEFNIEQQGSEMPYVSSFTFTVIDEKDSQCQYTAPAFIVLDPGFSLEYGTSAYELTVTSEEGESRNVTEVATETTTIDSEPKVWQGSAEVKLTYLSYTLGDINVDGNIDTFDAFAVLEYYAQKAAGYTDVMFTDGTSLKAENAAFAAADVNKDGEADTLDAFKTLRYYAMQSSGESPEWE